MILKNYLGRKFLNLKLLKIEDDSVVKELLKSSFIFSHKNQNGNLSTQPFR